MEICENIFLLFSDIERFLKNIDFLNPEKNEVPGFNEEILHFSAKMHLTMSKVKIIHHAELLKYVEFCYENIQEYIKFVELIKYNDTETIYTYQVRKFARKCKEDEEFYNKLKTSVSEILKISEKEQEKLYKF